MGGSAIRRYCIAQCFQAMRAECKDWGHQKVIELDEKAANISLGFPYTDLDSVSVRCYRTVMHPDTTRPAWSFSLICGLLPINYGRRGRIGVQINSPSHIQQCKEESRADFLHSAWRPNRENVGVAQPEWALQRPVLSAQPATRWASAHYRLCVCNSQAGDTGRWKAEAGHDVVTWCGRGLCISQAINPLKADRDLRRPEESHLRPVHRYSGLYSNRS